MTTEQIAVCHCTDRHGQPLLALECLPLFLCGEGAELHPATARAYAQALLQAADDCESTELGHTDPRVSGVRKVYEFQVARHEMHPEQIKAGLRMKGITPTALADELGVGHSAVSQVITGKSVSTRIRASIAEILGVSVEALWPPSKTKPALRRSRAQVQAMRARAAA